jgi:hypothetical protein
LGLFSNGSRNNKVAKISYDEDLHEIIVADRLGMTECWISGTGRSSITRRRTSFRARTCSSARRR